MIRIGIIDTSVFEINNTFCFASCEKLQSWTHDFKCSSKSNSQHAKLRRCDGQYSAGYFQKLLDKMASRNLVHSTFAQCEPAQTAEKKNTNMWFVHYSSLRSLIEKPPITGKELNLLSGSQLTGFRLHPGPVSAKNQTDGQVALGIHFFFKLYIRVYWSFVLDYDCNMTNHRTVLMYLCHSVTRTI